MNSKSEHVHSLVIPFPVEPRGICTEMASNPNVSCSSDCSTEILVDTHSEFEKKDKILENNLSIVSEDKKIYYSSKFTFHDSRDVLYASAWNKMWLEHLEKLAKK